MKITYKASPNCSPRKSTYNKPDMICCHITDGKFNGAVSWLCDKKSQVSAHFVISRKGEIVQLVPIEKMAWANGTSTKASAGNYYGKSKLATVRNRKTNANYYTISIELEGFTSSTAGRLTDEQYDALVELIKYLQDYVYKHYRIKIPFDRSHIVGHCDIAPKTKPFCPGVNFPWNELMTSLNKPAGTKGEPVVSSVAIEVNKDGAKSVETVYRVFYKDTNYLKLRDVCEIANIPVGYNGNPTVTVNKPVNPSIQLFSDKVVSKCPVEVIYNGSRKTVNVNSILMDGTNYIRIRDLGQLIGVEIGYNSATSRPTITI